VPDKCECQNEGCGNGCVTALLVVFFLWLFGFVSCRDERPKPAPPVPAMEHLK
jgi:hypothetical protein